MLPESVQRVAQRLDCESADATMIQGLSIDSRTTQPGDLFIALQGDRDGHEFVTAAQTKGAVAALVSQPTAQLPSIEVPDTEAALTALASAYRAEYSRPVLALTGSQGKTSTRGFIESILRLTARRLGYDDILVTRGNFNNQLGVPLTASRLRPHQGFAVFELGASKVGDIAHLAKIVKPHFTALLNARAAHLEGFGSIPGVIEGKGEIIDHTDLGGTCVLNRDEPAFETWNKRAGTRRVVTFGKRDADVVWCAQDASRVKLRVFGDSLDVLLPTLGQHFMENAAAACALTGVAGATLEDMRLGLETAVIEPGRMTPIRLPNLLLIDDTYNASPEAVTAAVDWLAQQAGVRTLVMGALAELGDDAEAAMFRLGQYAKQRGVDQLIAVADAAPIADGFGADAQHFESLDRLQSEVGHAVEVADVVLVKGSRASRMDRVIDWISSAQGAF